MKKSHGGNLSHLKLAIVFIILAILIIVPMSYARNSWVKDLIGNKNPNKTVPPVSTSRRTQSGEKQDSLQLSAEAVRQIAALLDEKERRTPAQRKIDSQLLQGVRESRGERMATDVNLERTNIKADNTGMILVDITADVSDGLLKKLERLGSEIIFPSVEYKAIRARVPLSLIETIASYPEIIFIRGAVPAMTNRRTDNDTDAAKSTPLVGPVALKKPAVIKSPRHLTFEERAANVRSQLLNYMSAKGYAPTPFVGAVTSQGDKAHQADTAKSQYGFSGEGIKIGVMSDSFNYRGGLAADIAGGDLPGAGNPFGNTTPVTIVQDLPAGQTLISGTDEGRAMMQIVHDIAPKAQLFFASAFISEAGFATNIKKLRDAPNNCDIVIDDVFYSDEAPFQDSTVAKAVNYVTASGGLYFSSAGNQGSVRRSTASVWEGDFNDAGSVYIVPGNGKSGTVHNWGTVGSPLFGNVIQSNGNFAYTLDWSDPLGASTNDYDLFVVNSTGTTVKASSTNIQNGTIDPHEEFASTAFSLSANNDRLVVFKTSSSAVRAIAVNGFGSRLAAFTTGQTHGHSCAADAFGVAAAGATAANTVSGVFTGASRVETFSSDGPRRVFYNENGTPITPGNLLFGTSGGTVRQKPDLTAADNVTTSGNQLSGSLTQFSGTSAAAPHAGAIAALIKSANPSLTPAQIRTILTTNVIDIEDVGTDVTTGVGIINANAAVLATATQQADLTFGSINATEGLFSNANTIIDPGEYANIVVPINNPSLTNALNVNATLTTSTVGVTIIQGSASYGSITSGGNATNSGSPFVIGISQSVPCGTAISLTVTATLANGSPISQTFTVKAGSILPLPISATFTSPASGAGFTSSTGTEPSRLTVVTPASSCAANKATPATTAGNRRYDAYTFTNTTGVSQCVTVNITASSAATLRTATYNNGGFAPATPTTNYLADSGTSVTNPYAFNVAAGQQFTTVIFEQNANAGTGTYTLNVGLGSCSTSPTCTPVNVTTASIASGSTGSPYSQSFSATGGSGNYTYSLSGGLPAGLTFSGNTLSGTPTQAGSFPITLTVTDAAGCPTGTQNYTLVIAGNAPASITTTAGDGQTALPGKVFATALKATVLDASSNPLSGVNVTFTAPPSGASGTFAGSTTATVITDVNGVATAPAFTANTSAGSYVVTASVVGVATSATFNLSNTCPSSFVVTTNADSGAGSLRDVINNVCVGSTITFDPGVTGTITLSDELIINKSLTINGPGTDKLAVSGNNNSRVFNVAPGAGNTVSITGLTVKNGATKADGSDFYGGGGILILNGIVNLTDLHVTGNSATNTGNFPQGGGIDNEGGAVTVTRCAITNNTLVNNIASNGPFYVGAGIFSEGTGSSMNINNSTISGNSAAPYGRGGGLAFVTNTTLTNSTVYGNSANVGGNILRLGGTLTFKNNIIAGGTLTGTGGSAVDISGTGFSSQDYNLIQTTTGGTITGTTTNNITGVSPNLRPLANYGGPTPSHLPMNASPVVNKGDVALVSGTDQRGLSRVMFGRADIGAVELNINSIVDFDGDGKTDAAVVTPVVVIRPAGETKSATGDDAAKSGRTRDVKVIGGDILADERQRVWSADYNKLLNFRSGRGFVPLPKDVESALQSQGLKSANDASSEGSSTPVMWMIRRSSDGSTLSVTFGTTDDVFVPADYDGDRKTDVAVWNGTQFRVLTSASNYVTEVDYTLGTTGSDPTVVGDYDGDGLADPAVYDSSTGLWAWLGGSSHASLQSQIWMPNGIPAPGDYNGDGKMDFGIQVPPVASPDVAKFRIAFNDGSVGSADMAMTYGLGIYQIVPGDYDGDGKTDIAQVNLSGTDIAWRVLTSMSSYTLQVKTTFGKVATDKTVQGDYDGDGKIDRAVYRSAASPEDGVFRILQSSDSTTVTFDFGGPLDNPVAFFNTH